jgi:hypothetical protein
VELREKISSQEEKCNKKLLQEAPLQVGEEVCFVIASLLCDDLLTDSKTTRDNWENREHSCDIIFGDVKRHWC